jgi:hypothetical protein
LVAGTVLSAATSLNRPPFVAANPLFGNRPTFAPAATGDLKLSGTLANAVPTGAFPGLFVVYRLVGTGVSGSRYIAGITSVTSAMLLGGSDANFPAPYILYASAAGGYSADQYPSFNDEDAHVDYGFVLPTNAAPYQRIDTAAEHHTGPLQGALLAALTAACIGANNAAAAAADCEVAFVAALKAWLPKSVQDRAINIARSTYGIP